MLWEVNYINFLASDISLIENVDELEVYGSSENPSGTTITSFVFEVSLLLEFFLQHSV